MNTAMPPSDTVFDVERIKKMIPHRYPILMIDRVCDLVRDKSATGIKNVTVNEPYFQGHFPEKPIMPGVLIIEAMAQTSAVLVVASLGEEMEGRLVYFMSVDHARFRKLITPGDTVYLHIEKIHKRGAVWKFKAQAMVDGVLMADATFAAMIVDPED